jgi:hypothetical protein
MLHVIEGEDRVENHEPRFVFQCGIRLTVVLKGDRFKPRRRVVTEVADRPAGEARELGHEGRSEVGHHLSQHIDELFVLLCRDAGLFDNRFALAGAQHDERVLPEKRITADVLAPFNALEKKRVIGMLGDTQKRRYRRE